MVLPESMLRGWQLDAFLQYRQHDSLQKPSNRGEEADWPVTGCFLGRFPRFGERDDLGVFPNLRNPCAREGKGSEFCYLTDSYRPHLLEMQNGDMVRA